MLGKSPAKLEGEHSDMTIAVYLDVKLKQNKYFGANGFAP